MEEKLNEIKKKANEMKVAADHQKPVQFTIKLKPVIKILGPIDPFV